MPTVTAPPPCSTAPNLFHPADGERASSPAGKKRIADAKALCFRCPIMWACRAEGRTHRAVGIWGGETEAERRRAGARPKATIAVKAIRAGGCGDPAGAQRHRRAGNRPCDACLAAESEAAQRRKAAREAERPATMPARGPQILGFLDDSMTPVEIAHHLRLSKATIYGHIQRICAALGVPSHLIVATARARGILPATAVPAAAADRERVAA